MSSAEQQNLLPDAIHVAEYKDQSGVVYGSVPSNLQHSEVELGGIGINGSCAAAPPAVQSDVKREPDSQAFFKLLTGETITVDYCEEMDTIAYAKKQIAERIVGTNDVEKIAEMAADMRIVWLNNVVEDNKKISSFNMHSSGQAHILFRKDLPADTRCKTSFFSHKEEKKEKNGDNCQPPSLLTHPSARLIDPPR